jgi:hypothetical protein
VNVGDVFISLRADKAQFDSDTTKAAGDAGTHGGESFSQKFKSALTKSHGGLAEGVVQGLGLAGGLAIAHLAEEAIGHVTEVLGEAVNAAKDAQVENAKLEASLQANVAGWDGNTAAIEATIKAREQLGFTDNEQKQALALLVVQTHDVTKALAAERVAMDLARLKGIDLASASVLVGKSYIGSTTALKKLGIELPKGVKGMDALAAITKVAGGQAEEFAKTTEGAGQAVHAEFEGALEKLGAPLLAIEGAFMHFAAVTIPFVIGGIDTLATQWQHLMDLLFPGDAEIKKTTDALQAVGELRGMPQDVIDKVIALQKALAATAKTSDEATSKIEDYAFQSLLSGQTVEQVARTEAQIGADRTATYKAISQAALDMGMSTSDAYNFMVEGMVAFDKEAGLMHDAAVQQASDTRDTTDAQWRANTVLGQAFATWDAYNAQLVANAADAKDAREETTKFDAAIVEHTGNVHLLAAQLTQAAGSTAYIAAWGDAWSGASGKAVDAFIALKAKLQAAADAAAAAAAEAYKKNMDTLAGITRHSLKDAKDEAKKGMADVIWALKHPMAEAKLEHFYGNELTKAEHALDRAFKSGNPVAIAKAEALVAGIKAALAELRDARISMVTNFQFATTRGDAWDRFHATHPNAGNGGGGNGFAAATSQGVSFPGATSGNVHHDGLIRLDITPEAAAALRSAGYSNADVGEILAALRSPGTRYSSPLRYSGGS